MSSTPDMTCSTVTFGWQLLLALELHGGPILVLQMVGDGGSE
jgi:hypothetical protein